MLARNKVKRLASVNHTTEIIHHHHHHHHRHHHHNVLQQPGFTKKPCRFDQVDIVRGSYIRKSLKEYEKTEMILQIIGT